VRCYGELNDFLAKDRRHCTFTIRGKSPRSVKDILESVGVPHTEIQFAMVDEKVVPLPHVVREDCRIAAYPACFQTDLAPDIVPPWPAPEDCRFIADVHLGKLVRILRLLGFDCLYNPDWDDPELAQISADERRVLLTRDAGLLKRSIVPFGVYVRTDDPEQQAAYLLARLQLHGAAKPGSRCMACNGQLREATAEEAREHVPPKSLVAFDQFYVCPDCGRAFWQGSHWENLDRLRTQLLAN
jgi:uncharacterized protein with PIN domain